MLNDKRKGIRRPMRYTAWIAQKGKPLYGCVVSDVSEKGARLDVESTDSLPDEFMLFLSRLGTPRRKCHVAWRSPTQLGVEFQLQPEPKNQNTAVKAMLAAKKMERAAQRSSEVATGTAKKTREPA
jgi:hypothetical protein